MRNTSGARGSEEYKMSIYQDLLAKIDRNCVKQRKNLMNPSHSPTLPDLLHAATAPNLTSHCPCCRSLLNPKLPPISTRTLLPSLKSCEMDLKFLNCIVWMKSMATSMLDVPIADIKDVLKVLLKIEEEPAQPSQPDEPQNPTFQFHQRGEKRKLEDSAVELAESPRRTWNYTSDLPEKPSDLPKKFTSIIPDTDEEASQRSPEISFSDSSQDSNPRDSGIGHMTTLPSNSRPAETVETVSALNLSLILREFPVNSVALSIVRTTLTALESEETAKYSWREGDVVSNAVNVILDFISLLTVEEHRYPGYLDFFTKCAVETIKNVFTSEAKNLTAVERGHHLMLLLELCNCRVICEEVITYFFEELGNVSEESREFASTSRVYLLMDALYVAMEKYHNMPAVVKQSRDFFEVTADDPSTGLLNLWSERLSEFTRRYSHVCPTRVSFLRTIFANLREST